MTVAEIKSIVLDAVHAKEHSDDETFAEVLQGEIHDFLSTFTQLMGKPIDDISDKKKVPKELEEAANKLTECHTV